VLFLGELLEVRQRFGIGVSRVLERSMENIMGSGKERGDAQKKQMK
jgi:hypothetical protein